MSNIEDMAGVLGIICIEEGKTKNDRLNGQGGHDFSQLSYIAHENFIQCESALYSIRVEDDDSPIQATYGHGHYWQLGVGRVRAAQILHGDRPIGIVSVPKWTAEKIELAYTRLDGSNAVTGPWPEILLAAIIRISKRLRGSRPRGSQVIRAFKSEIVDVILDDTGLDIAQIEAERVMRAGPSLLEEHKPLAPWSYLNWDYKGYAS